MDACDKGMIILALDVVDPTTFREFSIENIVGFAHYRRYVRGDKVRLYTMSIEDDKRGCGWGTEIIDFLSKCHAGMIITEVRDSNIDSQRFFIKCGFIKDSIDVRENYTVIKYFKKIDAPVM